MLIIILVGAGLIVCALDAQKAEKTNSSYADTIAAHNYSTSVINQCVDEASKNDYILSIKRYDTNSDGYMDICECILEYDYSLKFLNSNDTTANGKHHFSRIMK
ncbi:MAG: hypothetical protein K5644_06325 [Lachnospiraceae bacterium]|nr:hypothetical protein [Lachnospiraceae bacterium]